MNFILELLQDGKVHSGEEIGQYAGISRAAVWKQIQKLVASGVPVESRKGLGYQLVSGSMLSLEKLESVMADLTETSSLFLLPTTSSTNTDCMTRLRGGDRGPVIVFSEYQSAGRGRFGRIWSGSWGENIYCSFGWKYRGPLSDLSCLSLAAGLWICECLPECRDLWLKWPNDLMIGKKKLGGVLVEMEGVPDGEINLVIGVGLNVNMVAGGPDDRAWISLRQVSGEMFDRNDLARKLISRITKGFEDCLHSDFRDCLDRWRCLDGLLGKALVVLNYSCKVTGTGIGVDDSGQYGLRDSAGNIHWFSSGEISLREAGDGISGY